MVNLFNYYLKKMQEAGIMSNLELEMRVIPKRTMYANEIKENVLGYEHVVFPFSILLIGVLASIVHVFIEAILFWIKNVNKTDS